MWVDCELLEGRQLLAGVPLVKGIWEGSFENSMDDSGRLFVKLKQDGKKITGSVVDDDGVRYKLVARIDREGVMRGTLKSKRVFNGTIKCRVRGLQTSSRSDDYIKGRYEGDTREGAVVGKFRIDMA